MKAGTQVNLDRSKIASTLAADLPSFIFWNPGTVKKVSIASGVKRVCVLWNGTAPLWFDYEALSLV
jgi:hypothetical protein